MGYGCSFNPWLLEFLPTLNWICRIYVLHVLSNLDSSLHCPLYEQDFLSSTAGDMLMLLSVASDSKVLPTTYGELRPPLGKHRLKVRSFLRRNFSFFFLDVVRCKSLRLNVGLRESDCFIRL